MPPDADDRPPLSVNSTSKDNECQEASQTINKEDDVEIKIDKLYKKLKLQNRRLQDIKLRKPSKYTESTLENQLKQEQLITQFLDEIEQMNEAWIANLKLRTDNQKKAFLTDYVFKSKTIGIENTVDAMIPCLVNAYYSD